MTRAHLSHLVRIVPLHTGSMAEELSRDWHPVFADRLQVGLHGCCEASRCLLLCLGPPCSVCHCLLHLLRSPAPRPHAHARPGSLRTSASFLASVSASTGGGAPTPARPRRLFGRVPCGPSGASGLSGSKLRLFMQYVSCLPSMSCCALRLHEARCVRFACLLYVASFFVRCGNPCIQSLVVLLACCLFTVAASIACRSLRSASWSWLKSCRCPPESVRRSRSHTRVARFPAFLRWLLRAALRLAVLFRCFSCMRRALCRDLPPPFTVELPHASCVLTFPSRPAFLLRAGWSWEDVLDTSSSFLSLLHRDPDVRKKPKVPWVRFLTHA